MGDLYEAHLDSMSHEPGGPRDPRMALFKFSPVPKNSGAQNVVPIIMQLFNKAKRLRNGALKKAVTDMATESIYGYVAIGSEGGFNSRELNTSRYASNGMGVNVGPPVNALDEYVNGKMENNPRTKDLGLDI